MQHIGCFCVFISRCDWSKKRSANRQSKARGRISTRLPRALYVKCLLRRGARRLVSASEDVAQKAPRVNFFLFDGFVRLRFSGSSGNVPHCPENAAFPHKQKNRALSPILVRIPPNGAAGGSRTLVSTLGRSHNSRYTTAAKKTEKKIPFRMPSRNSFFLKKCARKNHAGVPAVTGNSQTMTL